jgi:two-component system, sensor histidine kinase and response regulator
MSIGKTITHVVLLICLLSTFSLKSQTKKFYKLLERATEFEQANKVDSSFAIITAFISKNNLTNDDKFYAEMLFAHLQIENNLYEKAIVRMNVAKQYVFGNKQKQDTLMAFVNERISGAFFSLQKYDSALYYGQKAEQHLSQMQPFVIAENYQILGYCYLINKDYQVAKNYSLRATVLFNQIKDYSALCNANNNLLKIYAATNKKDEFEKVLKATDSLTRRVGNLNSLKIFYTTLSKIYTERKSFEKALIYHIKVDSINDVINIESAKQQLVDLEEKYKSTIKQQEITNLKSVTTEQKKVVEKQKLVIYISIIAALLFLILFALIIRFYQRQKKLAILLFEQKKQIESNLAEVERLNLLNQKIFSVISHDFKEPMATLNVLLNNKEVKNNADPIISAFLVDFQSQLNQSNNMLDSLLDWSRMELGIKTNLVNSNITSITTQLVSTLQPKAIGKQIQIVINGNNEVISSLPSQVYIICLRNIINNAIKFSLPNSTISILLSSNKVQIVDEGRGINPKKLAELFSKQVVSEFGTQLESGFGIGLYLCYELILKYGGTLEAKNNELKGCTFTINLPNQLG